MCTKAGNACPVAGIPLWGNKKERIRGMKVNKMERGAGRGEGRASSGSARGRAGGWPGGLAERPAGAALFLSH